MSDRLPRRFRGSPNGPSKEGRDQTSQRDRTKADRRSRAADLGFIGARALSTTGAAGKASAFWGLAAGCGELRRMFN